MPRRARRLRRGAAVGCFAALASCVLLGACATGGEPNLPQMLAHAARALAGLPPSHPDYYAKPVRVSETLTFTSITAGGEHTCALDIDGNTYCWGSNQRRQLGSAQVTETCGRGTFTCSSVPVRLERAPRFTRLAGSMSGTCGLDGSGAAYCWGFDFGVTPAGSSQAGGGVPVEIPGGHRFVALDSSPIGSRTCGLTAEGRVWCWGYESPPGGGPPVFVAPDLVAASAAIVAIDVGSLHACGIDAAGSPYCWGANDLGQLGTGVSGRNGGVSESRAAVAVQGGLDLERITAASGYSCGLDKEGTLHCWGAGFPQGPYRRVPDRRTATFVHGALPVRLWTVDPKWVEMSAGGSETCGLSGRGEVFCFVANDLALAAPRRPKRFDSDHAFIALAIGLGHTCAVGTDGRAYCWGNNNAGQVGRPPQG